MAPPAKGGGSSQQGGGFSSMLLFILPLFAIWYFLLIRPQQKKEKEKKSMLNELKKGEQIMTIGGIIGTVIQVKDSRVTVKIADKTNIEISKSAVANKISQ
ncbi:MAG: preprotein translocase subunit YajC [Spirochaetes bacterium]|nr:preprotein translocase subunit YajC [Spirochaetota bacterium]